MNIILAYLTFEVSRSMENAFKFLLKNLKKALLKSYFRVTFFQCSLERDAQSSVNILTFSLGW